MMPPPMMTIDFGGASVDPLAVLDAILNSSGDADAKARGCRRRADERARMMEAVAGSVLADFEGLIQLSEVM